ncbi:zn-c6 fungal-type dna-binding domain protein, partial [Nannochloropsis oceanica]
MGKSKGRVKKAGEGMTAGVATGVATGAATGAAASRVDRDFLPWPSAVKKRPRGSCEVCYQLKTQCDKTFPCGRCYRLNKPCRPPTESLELLHHPASSSSSSFSSPSSPSSSPSSPSPLLDLVIERIDFKPMVHLYMQAFHELREEGLVDRRRAIGLLRMWMNLGLLFGGNSDPTLGMFSQVQDSLGISGVELEDPVYLAHEAPLSVRRQRLRETQADSMAGERAKALRLTPAFQHADDGRRAVYLATVDGADSSVATNHAYDTFYRRPGELMQDMWERRCLISFLLASVVAPEDRLSFFRGLLYSTLTTCPAKMTGLVKCFDRQGNMTLFLVEARAIQLSPTAWAAMSIHEPAPSSRHITSPPRHHPH